MKKPITVAIDDFSNQLVDLINNSGLPFVVIEYEMKSLLSEIRLASEKQLNADKKSYEEYLKKTTSEKDGG